MTIKLVLRMIKKLLVFITILVALPMMARENKLLQNNKKNKTMKFELIKLPYATDALAPVISKETIEFHHGKHHLNYVNKLNELIQGTKFENADLETIVRESDGAIFNNAGQVLNHNLYFTQFKPKANGKPTGKLAEAIEKKWGSFENFKEEFSKAGAGLFGSGWVWLASDAQGVLEIRQYANAGNPVHDGLKALLGFDVWEHSYYLDYQNRRPDHLKALWDIIDWEEVAKRY